MSESTLNLGGPKKTIENTSSSASFSTEASISISIPSQTNSIRKKLISTTLCNDSSSFYSDSLESSEKDNGLDSLTVAASVISSRQGNDENEKRQKVIPTGIPKQPQPHPSLSLSSPSNFSSKASFSLPSITKVFPEHFGGGAPRPSTPPSTSVVPSLSQTRFNYPKNGPIYPQNQNLHLPSKHLGPFNNFKQTVPFVNGNYAPRNNSMNLNFFNSNTNSNSINYGHVNQQNQHQHDPRLFCNHPQQYTQSQAQVDRKRSYHQQGPSSLISEVISRSPIHFQGHSQSRNLPPVQAQAQAPAQNLNFKSFTFTQNPETHPQSHSRSRNSSQSVVNFSNSNNSINNNSTSINNNHLNDHITPTVIQNKLNFRNFALQLSSKSTNLTSNQAGTAAADKQHFAAIMQDCVVVSSVDYINSFRNYRPTINNKLKPLKFNEFIQEQLHFRYSEPTSATSTPDFVQAIPTKDDLVYFYKTPETFLKNNPSLSRFKIFRHSRTLGIAVYRKGQRIFPVTPEDIADFWTGVPRNIPLQGKERSFDDFQDDDLVLICRGYPENLENEADSLAEDVSKVQLGGDLDDVLPPQGHVFDYLLGETATVVAILGSEFDEYMLKGTDNRIKHVIHVEKNGHTAIDDPWPYAITKHTLVYRPYLAMLFSDASKINRFSPTIEFVIKKAITTPVGESILKSLGKLSEIQHMAGAMIVGEKLRYWATGGAILALLSRVNPKSNDWNVSFPGLTTWISPSFDISYTIPIGEIDVKSGDCILLCCPEVRHSWKEAEVVSIIKSRAVWPEKFQILTNRFKKERNSKNGLGLFEITLK